jgi:hypothetical protein
VAKSSGEKYRVVGNNTPFEVGTVIEILPYKSCCMQDPEDEDGIEVVDFGIEFLVADSTSSWWVLSDDIERIPREHYKTLGMRAKLREGDLVIFKKHSRPYTDNMVEVAGWAGESVKSFMCNWTRKSVVKVLRPLRKEDRL